jgi:hypothetical protein
MPTMQELLGTNFGVEDNVKTASVENDSELERIANELGFGKFASEDEEEEKTAEGDKEEEEEEEEEEEKEEKKASVSGDSLFDQMFPEDASLSKTAEEQEKMAYQETLGARAYDIFADRFDRRIEKLASEVTGGATISAATAPDKDGNAHTGTDKAPSQQSKNDKVDDGASAIDTDPEITNDLPAKNDARTVGHLEQKHAAVMSAAVRKMLLLSQLEG